MSPLSRFSEVAEAHPFAAEAGVVLSSYLGEGEKRLIVEHRLCGLGELSEVQAFRAKRAEGARAASLALDMQLRDAGGFEADLAAAEAGIAATLAKVRSR